MSLRLERTPRARLQLAWYRACLVIRPAEELRVEAVQGGEGGLRGGVAKRVDLPPHARHLAEGLLQKPGQRGYHT